MRESARNLEHENIAHPRLFNFARAHAEKYIEELFLGLVLHP